MALVVAVAGITVSAQAQTVGGTLTVDNAFVAYLSTSATTLGSQIASGNSWPNAVTFGPVALTPGQNYWLQVVAQNGGGPGGLLGSFTLSGGFTFANATQALNTNATDWTAKSGSFAGSAIGIVDEGANGVAPWGSFPGIAPTAHWIWESGNCGTCTVYFSTPIIANSVPPTTAPEPSTWALLGSGLLGIAGFARRRNRVA